MQANLMPVLSTHIRHGLIRELDRLGLITKEQFAKLMELQRKESDTPLG